ncbi:hypothetical protein B0A48_08290 [Cryoendolithus antarcticus]|uniref:Uncharacterized protein n=1 Tax=Cryoendolithus antarcticus TaxID=1507870 RepID=A0A1V8T512_9PEZI|nr:hypothetical protein B0A48_08290 [Cryoendolithus antarcticus]
MDLHLDIDREDLPSLVKRLDDALSGTKLWHATLVAEMCPFREVQIRCYSVIPGDYYVRDTTTIEFICRHNTVGELLKEIRHQWGPNGEEKAPFGSTKLWSFAGRPYDRLAQAIEYFGDRLETGWFGI